MVIRTMVAGWIWLFLLTGCSGGGESTPQGRGEPARASEASAVELRLPGGDWGLPTPFTFYPRGPGYVHLSLIYDTLVWKDRNGTIPWLAEKWESSLDGLVWTFHLRKGLKWQDGAPLTARDVRFSFDTLKRHPVEWFSLERLKSVEVLDELTVRLHLESPYAPFLNQVAGTVPIFPEHLWREVSNPREMADPARALGSGPYRLVHYDRAQGAYAYEANPDFFLGPPRVSRLFFVPAGDPVAALERGAVDEAPVPASLLGRLRQDNRFETLSGPAFWVLTLQFNRKLYPFDRSEVRQAAAHAVDRRALIEQAVPGGLEGARPGGPGFLPPESSWFDTSCQDRYPPDPSRALSLLRSAGIEDRNGDGTAEGPDGKAMRFTLITTAPYLREGEALKIMFRSIGFMLDIKTFDMKTLDAMVREGRFDLALTGHGGIGGDPSVILGFGTVRGDPFSSAIPWDPEYLKTAERLLTASDPAERMRLAADMQRLYAEELPCLPLYYPTGFIAYRPEVFKGWFYTAGGGISIGIPSPYNKLAFITGAAP